MARRESADLQEEEARVCINDALTDDELRAVLARLEREEEKDTFGLVCKRWLRLQSSERCRLRARAGPAMLRRMADRFSGLVELDLSQSASRSFYPGVTDSDLSVIAGGFRGLRVLTLQNCKGEMFSLWKRKNSIFFIFFPILLRVSVYFDVWWMILIEFRNFVLLSLLLIVLIS